MKMYQVSEELIKTAHKAACNEWKKILSNEFPEIFDNEAEIGDVYLSKREGSHYILAQIGPGVVVAIGLKTGNRYTDPIRVKNISNITREELTEIFDTRLSDFQKINQFFNF